MNRGALIWMIIFAVSAICFFTVAAVVGVKGFSDLRELLRSSKPEEHNAKGAHES